MMRRVDDDGRDEITLCRSELRALLAKLDGHCLVPGESRRLIKKSANLAVRAIEDDDPSYDGPSAHSYVNSVTRGALDRGIYTVPFAEGETQKVTADSVLAEIEAMRS